MTMVLVVIVVGVVGCLIIVLALVPHFTIDRLLGIVGALGAVGWAMAVVVSRLKDLFSSDD